MVALLLHHGAVVDKANNYGKTPLHAAADVSIDTIWRTFIFLCLRCLLNNLLIVCATMIDLKMINNLLIMRATTIDLKMKERLRRCGVFIDCSRCYC